MAESVRAIARRYGHEYFAAKARADERSTSCGRSWRSRVPGANLPEAYGGGGHGIIELAIVARGARGRRQPAAADRRLAGDLRRRSSPARDRRAEGALAARDGDGEAKLAFAITEPDAGSNSHNLSTAARGTATSGPHPGQEVHLRRRRGGRRARRRRAPRTPGPDAAALAVHRRHRRARLREARRSRWRSPVPERQFTLFFDDVRLPADALVGERGRRLAQLFSGLNPERIMAAALETGIGLYALEKASAYAKRARGLGCPDRQPSGRRASAGEGQDRGRAGPADDAEGGLAPRHRPRGRARREHGEVRGRRGRLAALDQAIQTHGGNGMATEYGLADALGRARLSRTAPVSREMIFNFIAQHSLGLPRSVLTLLHPDRARLRDARDHGRLRGRHGARFQQRHTDLTATKFVSGLVRSPRGIRRPGRRDRRGGLPQADRQQLPRQGQRAA